MKEKYKIITVVCLLFLIFCLAIFLRTFSVYKGVFSDPIKYSADDGVYHMRLVENMLLGGHFPFRIYFDPFTNFPNGTYTYFAPLFDWLLAVIIWVATLGKPTLEAINKIAPFYPVFLGSLLIFIVYFIAKALWQDRRIALFSAFLSGISTTFLYKSLMGLTDHHVAEILFSSLAMMFLFFSLKSEKNTKKFWIFTFLTGFSLGLYFLAWTGAIFFLFLIFCFIVLYYLIEYFLQNRQNWILYMGLAIFVIPFLMIAPFFGHPDLFYVFMYNIMHILAFSLGIFAFLALFGLDYIFEKKRINKKLFPLFFILALVLLFGILWLVFPFLFNQIIGGFKEINSGIVQNPLARALIGEVAPLGFNGIVQNYWALFFISLVALGIIIYQYIKNKKPENFLIIFWSGFMLFMVGIIPYFGQNRFSSYLTPIFSLLTGFLLIKAFDFGWQSMQKSKELPEENPIKKYLLAGGIIIVFNVFYFLLYPFPFNAGAGYPLSLPYIIQDSINTSPRIVAADSDRYEIVNWLKNNTPDPGLNYYELYKEPGIDKKTNKINPYPYPAKAYGILAVWDIGHMITYYAHRIPVANPFQQGIGKKNADGTIVPGEATFFLETDENKANQYLDQLRVKYVISDAMEANSDSGFQQLIQWQQGNFDGYLEPGTNNIDQKKFNDSMIARLELYDGRQTSFEKEINGKKITLDIKPLNRFRLLYESGSVSYTLQQDAKNEIKQFKVFEYVKGAKIKGVVFPETQVEISAKIKTNYKREFLYKQIIKAENGSFEFIVPYATGKQKNSEITAGSYMIKIGNYTREIKISEDDILQGKIINI